MGIILTTKVAVLETLSDGEPRPMREVMAITGLKEKAIDSALRRCWKEGLLLRTEKPIFKHAKTFKGRNGVKLNMRHFYLYLLRPEGSDGLNYRGRGYVKFDEKYLDNRGKKGRKSKASMIVDYLEENRDKAFYSTGIFEALKDKGIKIDDVSGTIRRYERKGLIYLRGYRSGGGDRETPFEKGYIATYIDQDKDRKEAIEKAVERTNQLLLDNPSKSPIIERIHRIRDIILSSTQLREIVSKNFLLTKLRCSEWELHKAIKRMIQLYPDIKVVKLFDMFPHYYHDSIDEKDLNAVIELKKNYIRKTGGRNARIGHNWEGVVTFFIDYYTDAEFTTQKHRTKMDERRITVHLIRPVGGRRHNAEIDRVWRITPSIFSQTITYCLEAKWGVVMKKHLDDFLNILKFSKEFGYDTEKGREIRTGIIPVFAGGTFNPNEKVYLENETIELTTWAHRMNVQLLRASDFNEKLRERGINTNVLTVQKVCRICKDEKKVKEVLSKVFQEPKKAGEILRKTIEKNEEIYKFEKILEQDK